MAVILKTTDRSKDFVNIQDMNIDWSLDDETKKQLEASVKTYIKERNKMYRRLKSTIIKMEKFIIIEDHLKLFKKLRINWDKCKFESGVIEDLEVIKEKNEMVGDGWNTRETWKVYELAQ